MYISVKFIDLFECLVISNHCCEHICQLGVDNLARQSASGGLHVVITHILGPGACLVVFCKSKVESLTL